MSALHAFGVSLRSTFSRAAVLLTLSLLGAASASAATYSYTSPNYVGTSPFTAAPCPGSCANFTLAMRLQGTVSTAAPLPASMALTEITRLTLIRAATDASGALTTLEVRIGRWQTAAPHVAGNFWDELIATTIPQAVAYHNVQCVTVGVAANGTPDSCTAFPGVATNMSSASSAAGVPPTIALVPAAAPATQQVPTLGHWSVFVPALAMAAAGALRQRRSN